MATITQRLAFLVSANADQAIRAFDKTASTAERQMGKAGKSIDKLGIQMTKFGAAGLAAAGTLGAGLYKLAQGAIDDQKAQALLAQQLKASTGATEAQIKAVEKMIDATARATGVADDQLRPALGNLVRATKDVDQAQRLLQLSLDVSAATGRDLETVTLAIGKAANGNVSALSRMGIPLSDNIKKAKDSKAAFAAMTREFGGQAAVAADTFAGKMARANVAISEAGEQIGSAFVPFVEKGATAVAGAINQLSKLDTATGGAIGKFAAFGTVGLGAVSALSLVGGQAIKLRDRFTTLGDDGERSLNRLGSAAKYASLGIATIAASEAAFAVLNEIGDKAGDADRALQGLTITLGKSKLSNDEIIKSFANLVKEEDQVLRFSNIWTDFGKEITLVGTKGSRNIEDIDRAFNKLLKTSPTQAQLLVDALKAQNATLDVSSQQYKDNASLVTRYQERIDLLVGSTEALTNATTNSVASLNEVRKQYQDLSRVLLQIEDQNAKDTFDKLVQKQRDLKDAQTEATRKAADFKQSILDQAAALKEKLNAALDQAKGRLKAAKDEYDNYVKSVSGSITSTLSLAGAQATADENAKGLTAAYKEMNDAQKAYNDSLKENDPDKTADALANLTEKQKAYNDALSKPVDYMKIFEKQAQAASGFAGNIQKLLDLGADQTVIDQLLAAGADTGGKIAAQILDSTDPKGQVDKINGLVKSTQDIADKLGVSAADKYKASGVTLAQNLVDGMNQVLSKAKIKLTWKALNKNGKPVENLKNVTDLLGSEVEGLFSVAGVGGDEIPALANGGIVRASSGGTMALLGEGGRDEAVIPLPASGQLGTSITINVTAGMGADGVEVGRSIVDALVAYQRRVGALPIKVGG